MNFQEEIDKFDNLNPRHDRTTRQRLNAAQKTLLTCFVLKGGGLQNLCQKHLIEFAGISKSCLVSLEKFARSDLKSVPPRKRRISPGTLDRIKESCSINCPSSYKMYQLYRQENSKGTSFYVCWETWRQTRLSFMFLFPSIFRFISSFSSFCHDSHFSQACTGDLKFITNHLGDLNKNSLLTSLLLYD